jgi:hypothetical protein
MLGTREQAVGTGIDSVQRARYRSRKLGVGTAKPSLPSLFASICVHLRPITFLAITYR